MSAVHRDVLIASVMGDTCWDAALCLFSKLQVVLSCRFKTARVLVVNGQGQKIKMKIKNMKILRLNLCSPANHSFIVQILEWSLKSTALSCASALTVCRHSGSGSDFEFIHSKSHIYSNSRTEHEAKPLSMPGLTCGFSFKCAAILRLYV